MPLTQRTIILLPIGLGLPGFIGPGTIGGHLWFLNPRNVQIARNARSRRDKISAVGGFAIAFLFGLYGDPANRAAR